MGLDCSECTSELGMESPPPSTPLLQKVDFCKNNWVSAREEEERMDIEQITNSGKGTMM